MPIFGKKEEQSKKQDQFQEDLPDELPSLAEEVVEANSTEASKNASEESSQTTQEENSDEEMSDIPDELPDITPENSSASDEIGISNTPKEIRENTVKGQNLPEESFFSDIDKRIMDSKESTAILEEMKRYWSEKLKKEEIDMPSLIETKKRIMIIRARLENLEKEWISSQKQFQIISQNIGNIEAEIQVKTDELKKLQREEKTLSRLQESKKKLTKPIISKTDKSETANTGTTGEREQENRYHEKAPRYSFSNPFILKNGRKVYSIKELGYKIAVMGKEEFNNNIFPKNHFAAWIADVFKDKELAKEVESIKDQNKLSLFLSKQR